MKSLKVSTVIVKSITYIFCIIGFILSVGPLVWTISTSLKPVNEIFSYPPTLIPSQLQFDNYITAWNSAPFARFFLNTIFVSVVSVAGQVGFSALAAYAFARIRFPGREIIFLSFICSMMIPIVIVLIPQFLIMRSLNWLDTFYAITGFFGNAFAIFFMRQFFITVPDSMEESAQIDGCGRFGIFMKIFIPISKHALITLTLIQFVRAWNNFFWPLIVTNRESMKVLPVAISTTFFNYVSVDWSGLTAASTMALMPIVLLFFFSKDYLIESISLTGFK